MRVIIPARAGSTRIPGKNMKLFHGKPIIQYSIDTARQTGLFQEIIVSTDCPEITEYTARQGCSIHRRPEELAHNDIGTQTVAASVIASFGIQPFDIVCVLYATSPLLTPELLREGMYSFYHSSDKYVYSVGPDGEDAGNFYWGHAQSFYEQIPLDKPMILPRERVCSINTPADWVIAETMYGDLCGH